MILRIDAPDRPPSTASKRDARPPKTYSCSVCGRKGRRNSKGHANCAPASTAESDASPTLTWVGTPGCPVGDGTTEGQ